VLLDKDTLDGIAAGRITLQFRRWKRPTVKAGGSLRTPVGVLSITDVRRISASEITPQEARQAGFDSKAALMRRLRPEGKLHRVAFELAGEDPRIALRQSENLTTEEVTAIQTRLKRMDDRATRGPWTTQTLELIARNPGVRAQDLAPQLHHERLPFKANVRKLKELGLTISLERGYELSPRGRAYLTRARPAPPE
jgi:hypothetical protein